jgi:hypothetical protein
MIGIITKEAIDNFEEFQKTNKTTQIMSSEDIHFIPSIDELEIASNDFGPGTSYLCKIELPLNVQQDQKDLEDEILSDVFSTTLPRITVRLIRLFTIEK